MRERLREQWSSDMPKLGKSNDEPVATATGASKKKAKSQREANAFHPKAAKELAEEWRTKIEQDKTRLAQGKKVLGEKIIPYFKEVQYEIFKEGQHEIASEDFSFGISQLEEQKPVRVHFRLGDGRIAEISVTSEGIIFERSDRPKESVTVGVEDAAQTIENITKLITEFLERKT
jgi:hypothetical protein